MLWHNIIRQDVGLLLSQVLLSKLEGPLHLDFFHAAVLARALDVGGGDVHACVGVELRWAVGHDFPVLPFFVYVDDGFRLRLPQTDSTLLVIGTNVELTRCAKVYLEL